MSLAGKTCWVVGGVGVIGRGITKGLLDTGATVIVNSRSNARLSRLVEQLNYPERLVAIEGSLLPGLAAKTVNSTLGTRALDHVVAHGSMRYYEDETHSMTSVGGSGDVLRLNLACEDSLSSSRAVLSHLVSFHLSAAQELLPRIQWNDPRSSDETSSSSTSYTFVTGDGGGHPGGRRSGLGEINAYQVWGLAAALRKSLLPGQVNCREVRVGLTINRPDDERTPRPGGRPLSEDVGRLCAGLCSNTRGMDDEGTLFTIDDEDRLEALLEKYEYTGE